MLSRVSTTPATLAHLNEAIDRIKSDGQFQRIADTYALPILIHQTLDTDWFQFLVSIGTVSFALSGVVLAYVGRFTLFEAMVSRQFTCCRRRRDPRSSFPTPAA